MVKTVKKLKLEIIKPHKPGLIDLTQKLLDLPGVDGVKTELSDSDKSTEVVRVRLEGSLNYDTIKNLIEESGGVIHSLNSVVAGKFLEE